MSITLWCLAIWLIVGCFSTTYVVRQFKDDLNAWQGAVALLIGPVFGPVLYISAKATKEQ